MTDDSRADRLRERRRKSSGRDDVSEQPDPSKPDEPDESESPESEASVKDEQVGTYMYLPEDQHRRLNHVYNRLKADYEFEFDEDFEKNRHFFPLVVEHGLAALEDCSPAEIRELLAER